MIKFDDYERHISYCGSKTRKCEVCGHNVCFKDWDSHEFGGECAAFKEEDIRMQLERAKKEEEEKKRKAVEEKKRRELEKQRELELAKRKKDMAKQFEDNFNLDEVDNERGGASSIGIQDKLPRSNEIKGGQQRFGGSGAAR